MNNGLQDLNGLSRENLLLLVAAQQNQLRSQQEQQEQQHRLAMLGQAGSLFGGRAMAAQAYGDLSSLLAPAAPSGSASLAELLRCHQALNATGQPPAGLADILHQGARLPGQPPAQAATAQDPLGHIRQLMLRRELLSNNPGAAAGMDALNPLLGNNSTSQDLLLRALMAGADANQLQLNNLPPAQAQPEVPAESSIPEPAQPSVAAAAADPPAREHEDEAQEEERALAAKGGAGKKKTKRPLSAYNIFFKEEHAKIIALNEQQKAERLAKGEREPSDDEYSIEEGTGKKRKRSLSTNQPGKRGKRQVDFENLTKVIGKRWKDLPKERVDEYKRRAEEAMQAYRKNLFQKIRNSVKEDQN